MFLDSPPTVSPELLCCFDTASPPHSWQPRLDDRYTDVKKEKPKRDTNVSLACMHAVLTPHLLAQLGSGIITRKSVCLQKRLIIPQDCMVAPTFNPYAFFSSHSFLITSITLPPFYCLRPPASFLQSVQFSVLAVFVALMTSFPSSLVSIPSFIFAFPRKLDHRCLFFFSVLFHRDRGC